MAVARPVVTTGTLTSALVRFQAGYLDSEARNRGNAALAELKAAAVDYQHNLSLLSDLEKSRVQLLHAREAALDRSRAAEFSRERQRDISRKTGPTDDIDPTTGNVRKLKRT